MHYTSADTKCTWQLNTWNNAESVVLGAHLVFQKVVCFAHLWSVLEQYAG